MAGVARGAWRPDLLASAEPVSGAPAAGAARAAGFAPWVALRFVARLVTAGLLTARRLLLVRVLAR
jgi:hypothetical protein